MTVTAPSLEKLNDTVQQLREIVGKMETCTQQELNRYEDKIRNEFQVIEASIAYVGRDIYKIAQDRRAVLRRQNLIDIQRLTNNNKQEVTDGTRSSGNTGDWDGTDKSKGIEFSGDKQASKPAKQSRRKK